MHGKDEIKKRLRTLLNPAVSLLVRLGVSPLAVTLAGLILSFVGAFEIVRGRLLSGGLFLLIAGICDTLDGSLARRTGRESAFGAFLDSTIDRIAELASFAAVTLYFGLRWDGGPIAVLLCLIALGGSFLTSYVRARAEGLGLECRVGWLERPERIAILVVGLLLGRRALFVAVVCLAVLTSLTVLQRIMHVRRATARNDAAAQGGSSR